MKLIQLPPLLQSPKSNYIQPLSLLLAVVLLIMVVAQLFKYEKFPEVISSLGVTGLESMIAAIIVILEAAALPFLLFMRLSRPVRLLSMIAGWMVVTWWVIAAVIGVITGAKGALLGAALELPSGWGSVFFALALAVLMAWVSWGMWPGRLSKE